MSTTEAIDLSRTANVGKEALERDESDLPVKVPLNTAWTLWLDNGARTNSVAEYEANIQQLYTFNEAHVFWQIYATVPDVSEIKSRYSYHLMREQQLPVWEKEYNRNGGTWRLSCDKKYTSQVWKEIIMAAIGEQFSSSLDEGDEILGVSVTAREYDDIVKIWNKDAALASKANVLDKVQSLLPGVTFLQEIYRAHQFHRDFDSARNKRSGP